MRYEITARRLREAMSDMGITQQELADKTQIGKSSISHYVNGNNEPGNKSAYKLAEVLNVNPAWLMGLDVPKESMESLQSKMTKTRLDYLTTDESSELSKLETEFNSLKADYDKLKKAIELFGLYENATPEAKELVESFLKSSQDKK